MMIRKGYYAGGRCSHECRCRFLYLFRVAYARDEQIRFGQIVGQRRIRRRRRDTFREGSVFRAVDGCEFSAWRAVKQPLTTQGKSKNRPGAGGETVNHGFCESGPFLLGGFDQKGSRVAQCALWFPPCPGGDNPVPVGAGAGLEVVRIHQHKVEMPAHGDVLKTIVQDEQIRRPASAFLRVEQQAGGGACAPGVNRDGCGGVTAGEHKRLIACLAHACVRLHEERKAWGGCPVAARQYRRAQPARGGPLQQPACNRCFARAAPGNIAYGNAGDGRFSEKRGAGQRIVLLRGAAQRGYFTVE